MWQGIKIIITGGSSGIGLTMAKMLASKGAEIALVARDEGKLAEAADEVRDIPGGTRPAIKSCDITDTEAADTAFSEISESMDGVDVLVNSAGILTGGYFERLPVDDFRRLMETNFFGTLNSTKAALPHIKKSGRAKIINISSVAGAIGAFGYTSYCASKFAITGFTDALRMEMKPQGIAVHLALPPQTYTPMLSGVEDERTPENRKLAASMATLTAEQTAKDIIKGVEKGRYLIVPGWQTRLMLRSSRWFPGFSRFVSDMIVKSAYRGPEND